MMLGQHWVNAGTRQHCTLTGNNGNLLKLTLVICKINYTYISTSQNYYGYVKIREKVIYIDWVTTY